MRLVIELHDWQHVAKLPLLLSPPELLGIIWSKDNCIQLKKFRPSKPQ